MVLRIVSVVAVGGQGGGYRDLYEGADGVFKAYLLGLISSILVAVSVIAAGLAGFSALVPTASIKAAIAASLGVFVGLSLLAILLSFAWIYFFGGA